MRDRLRYLRSWWLWLTPGMGVKRHVLLAIVGALVVIAGAILSVLWLVETLEGSRQTVSEPLERILISRFWGLWGGWISVALLVTGVVTAVGAVGRLNRSLLSNWMPRPREAAVVLHRRLSLARGPRIVALGGGTGLSNLLRGLRGHTSNITAVVTVSDDGGSSGRLRAAYGMPAPGDLTDCLAALSDNEQELGRLLEYRFQRGAELKGHTFGNLLITSLMEVEGDFADAIRLLNRLLNLVGSVYPATSHPVALEVDKTTGERVRGESRVREAPGPIDEVRLVPADVPAVPEVLDALACADLVVLGPGSLFTSVVAPLLVPGIRRALAGSEVPIVYVCNIMTEAGETDGYSAFDHVAALRRHLGRYPSLVAVNAETVDPKRRAAYRAEGAEVVTFDRERFAAAGVAVAAVPMLGRGRVAQHDSDRLAAWLVQAARTRVEDTAGAA